MLRFCRYIAILPLYRICTNAMCYAQPKQQQQPNNKINCSSGLFSLVERVAISLALSECMACAFLFTIMCVLLHAYMHMRPKVYNQCTYSQMKHAQHIKHTQTNSHTHTDTHTDKQTKNSLFVVRSVNDIYVKWQQQHTQNGLNEVSRAQSAPEA